MFNIVKMTHPTFPELPATFIDGWQTGYAHYSELQARHTVAVEDMTRLTFEKGVPPHNTQNEMVLYTLDGDIADKGGHDDFAHRLLVSFRPAPRKATLEDIPVEALTASMHQPSKSSMPAVWQQAKHGAYITDISLRRRIPLFELDSRATMYDARNKTQLVHQFADSSEKRYAVDPQGGRLEVVQRLPAFSHLVDRAFGNLVLTTTKLVADKAMLDAYAQAAKDDALNPYGIPDDLSRYRTESRDLDNPGKLIRSLVKSIEDSKGRLSADLVGKLMITGIDRIAALAIINSTAYYERDRGHVSFDRRLQWVEDHAHNFRIALHSFVEARAPDFRDMLQEELRPTYTLVERAEVMAADIQPPNATFPDGTSWKVSRAL